eukprot:CAMPEP_0174720128 /NCGR_PEP_ID=MMETSP1094-20130205/32873_1 /TAXON_ID=156173 /ORGANISM="Chrysochromulina brevifilum, Strain UTEX LB 985" /LENGTH=107 /DNA_ID=CAMNT_0015920575 /DNA_START=186 /DNA_END=509 /DNA_ORIENTATION=+
MVAASSFSRTAGSTAGGRAGEPTLYFTGLASPSARARLVLRASADGGQTWRILRVVWAGPAAYSSLSMVAADKLGVLYERGETAAAFFAQRIVFESLPLALLTPVGT